MIKINVLDQGYVLHKPDWFLGSGDLEPVNDAKVSYDRESVELGEKELKLLGFLGCESHTSPFRHSVMKFEIYAPLMVARQWWKYIVGSGHDESGQDNFTAWNESSRRYITEEPVFYIVSSDQWRSAPDNKKQGSGDPVPLLLGCEATKRLIMAYQAGYSDYVWALEQGICAEQARLYLPAYGLYVRWRWTASLQAVIHFVQQRIAHDAQKEIQEYAKAVFQIVQTRFEHSAKALMQ